MKHRPFSTHILQTTFTESVLCSNLSPASVSGRINVLNNLGVLYGQGGEHDKAFECFDQALRTWTLIQDTMQRVANLHMDQEHFDEALVLLECAECIQRVVYGDDSVEIVDMR